MDRNSDPLTDSFKTFIYKENQLINNLAPFVKKSLKFIIKLIKTGRKLFWPTEIQWISYVCKPRFSFLPEISRPWLF